jgi:transglutaminase-like putative cysteine protease
VLVTSINNQISILSPVFTALLSFALAGCASNVPVVGDREPSSVFKMSHADERCLTSLKSQIADGKLRLIPRRDPEIGGTITEVNSDSKYFENRRDLTVTRDPQTKNITEFEVYGATESQGVSKRLHASIRLFDDQDAVFRIDLKATEILKESTGQTETLLAQIILVDQDCRMDPIITRKYVKKYDSSKTTLKILALYSNGESEWAAPVENYSSLGPPSASADSSDVTTVSGAVWKTSRFGPKEKDADRRVGLAPGTILMATPLTISFETDRPLDFPNFSAYWEIEKSEKVSRKGQEPLQKLILHSKPSVDYERAEVPVTKNHSTGNRNLSESVFVNFSDPTVQAQILKLKATLKPSATRSEISREIVKLINSVMKYDGNSSDDTYQFNAKTSDILKTGLGVCQQFANVFAALARSLGVPTRIIGGLHLVGRSTLGLHAWDEIEIRDGVWVPVDPLNDELEFDPSHYIPLMIQRYETHPFRAPIRYRFLDDDSIYKVDILKSGV